MLTYKFKDKGFEGYLVIDSTVNGRCFGGIRILPDITLQEVESLARCMTLKYGFFGIKKGGAKAGLRINSKVTKPERAEMLKKFGKSIKPLLNQSYWPGFDMGCTAEDFTNMMKGAGRNTNQKSENKSSKYTSYTIFECAKIGMEMKNIKLENCTYAIQGFGNVGLECAKIFSSAGSKLVGISTVKGAIYSKDGLDVSTLAKLKKEYGDDCVKHYRYANKISKEKLLELDVDILIPCARPNSINKNNFNKVKAAIISPGANCVMSKETDKKLFRKGTLAFPDFISNSGGILGSILKHNSSDEKIRKMIQTKFRKKVGSAMAYCLNNNISPYETLSKIAMEKFRKMKEGEEKKQRNRKLEQLSTLFSRAMNRLYQDKGVDWE